MGYLVTKANADQLGGTAFLVRKLADPGSQLQDPGLLLVGAMVAARDENGGIPSRVL